MSTTCAKMRPERIRRFPQESWIRLGPQSICTSALTGYLNRVDIVRGRFLQGRDGERQNLRVQEGLKQQRPGEKSGEDPTLVSR